MGRLARIFGISFVLLVLSLASVFHALGPRLGREQGPAAVTRPVATAPAPASPVAVPPQDPPKPGTHADITSPPAFVDQDCGVPGLKGVGGSEGVAPGAALCAQRCTPGCAVPYPSPCSIATGATGQGCVGREGAAEAAPAAVRGAVGGGCQSGTVGYKCH